MSDFLIYGLRCPETGFYRYIGKSSNGLSRPKSHLILSHNQSVRLWVEDLRDKGLCPLIDIIEECDSVNLLEREKHWVNYYHNSVYPLMNIIEYKGINIEKLKEELKLEEGILTHKINMVKKDIDNLSDIYGFIKTVRKQRNVTQEVLSDISGVGLRTIKQIELGKGNPTFNTLKNILDVLGYEMFPCLKSMK